MNVAEKIAADPGETEKIPRKTIRRIVKVLGEERAPALLEETIRIHENGEWGNAG